MTGTDLRRSACHRYREEHQVFVDAAELMGGVELPRLTRALRLRDARIETRAKTVASFAKKAWLKREKYTDPWEQITDKVGGRIVVTSLRDLEALTDAVVNQRTGLKTLTEVDDKLHHLEVDRVGYLGRHVDVVVPGLRTADQGQIRCELQLRTLAMDLWAVTDYGLAYKSAAPLSSASARRLNRLAAINEIFDESVDQTLRELSQSPLAPLTELLRHAESIFLDFNDTPGRDDISLEVLQEVLPTIELPVDEYGDLLETFAARHHDKLAAIYDAFGAGSPWETDAKYIEFTQPEASFSLNVSMPMTGDLTRRSEAPPCKGGSKPFAPHGRHLSSCAGTTASVDAGPPSAGRWRSGGSWSLWRADRATDLCGGHCPRST